MDKQATDWETIFSKHMSDKGFQPEYTKNTSISITRIEANQLKSEKKNLDRHFSKEDIEMENKHIKKCSVSLIFRKMQIKTMIKCLFSCTRIAKVKNIDNIHCWLRYGATGTLTYHQWGYKMVGMQNG